MKVTVVGAGNYGSTTAHLLALSNRFDEIVMVDIVEGLPQGLALDMKQSRWVEGFDTDIVGTNDYEPTAGSDIVIVTAGKPRKPGMSRMDLLTDNAKIVGGIAEEVARTSPEAVVIVVSNPLDEMTALFQRVSGFPTERVIGQAGMLDSARFADKTAEKAGVSPTEVEAITLGSHGDTMVPVPSRVTVNGTPLREVLGQDDIDEIVKGTRGGGGEVVALLKTGSAYFAPSSAAVAMVNAIADDSGAMQPVCAWVDGEYGISGVYLGVPAKLGRGGIQEVVEIDLADEELTELRNAAEAVKEKQADINDLV